MLRMHTNTIRLGRTAAAELQSAQKLSARVMVQEESTLENGN